MYSGEDHLSLSLWRVQRHGCVAGETEVERGARQWGGRV